MLLSQKLLTWNSHTLARPSADRPVPPMLTKPGTKCVPGEKYRFPPIQVIGHSNFGTIRSTTCVYKGMLPPEAQRAGRRPTQSFHLLGLTLLLSVGKWVYEVLISSQGLMQIGWCTINCRFNQEVHTWEGALPERSSVAGILRAGATPRPTQESGLGCPLKIQYAPFYSSIHCT